MKPRVTRIVVWWSMTHAATWPKGRPLRNAQSFASYINYACGERIQTRRGSSDGLDCGESESNRGKYHLTGSS